MQDGKAVLLDYELRSLPYLCGNHVGFETKGEGLVYLHKDSFLSVSVYQAYRGAGMPTENGEIDWPNTDEISRMYPLRRGALAGTSRAPGAE